MVYVLAKDGQPLMPTERHGKVRRMLKSGEAKAVRRCPFTIQLTYDIEDPETQPVSLGVDAGNKPSAYQPRQRKRCSTRPR